jgi:lysophospholipase L1-like esterase
MYQKYYEVVKSTFGADLVVYWPLWESAPGLALDYSGRHYNAAYYGSPALFAQFSPYNFPATSFTTGQGVNVYGAGLADDFPYSEGSIFGVIKPASKSVWSDGSGRLIYQFCSADMLNNIALSKDYLGNLHFTYTVAGSTKYINIQRMETSAWVWFCFQWSGTALNVYVNGALERSVPNSDLWDGGVVPLISLSKIGGGWIGSISEFGVVAGNISAADVLKISQPQPTVTITAIGDSITAGEFNWYVQMCRHYNNGQTRMHNYAIPGSSIMGTNGRPFSDQVADSLNDNADIFIIAIGTNDGVDPDTVAVVDALTAGIGAITASNPGARLYYLNVLPQWTDNTGAVSVDKTIIRAAIASTCAALGVTCWDTSTWITAADTLDGLHPNNVTGNQKIRDQVLKKLFDGRLF